MPYKSEKIKIAGSKHDRRIKLTDDDKKLIRWLREEEKLSYQKLADKFNVSKRLILFVCKPETLKRNLEAREKRGGSKVYYNTEYNTETKREHRHYKQKLFLQGEMKALILTFLLCMGTIAPAQQTKDIILHSTAGALIGMTGADFCFM